MQKRQTPLGCIWGCQLWPGSISRLTAQTFEGLQNSNFAGVHSVYSNPALLTSMAYKRHANISTLGFEVNNNMFVLTAPFTLWQVITRNVPAQYQNANGKVHWQKDFYINSPLEHRDGDIIRRIPRTGLCK